jgi:anthraniloyl-CoA monooxygenase
VLRGPGPRTQMRIACLGGGPAGLYFAISMKLRDPAHEIDLFERNRPDDTFGWGVVFSDQTVENLMANDPVSGAIIQGEFAHWDDIDVHIHGETIRSSGHGFIGIGRKRLLNILQERARELGVKLHFEHEASPTSTTGRLRPGHRRRRRQQPHPRPPTSRAFRRRHPGAEEQILLVRHRKVFEAFTFAFEETEAGWVWAHAYRSTTGLSTFIVEMAPETWAGLGLDRMDQPEAIACASASSPNIWTATPDVQRRPPQGARGLAQLPRILCERWSYGT